LTGAELALIKAGLAAGGPSIRFVRETLEPGAREQIQRSFAQALEWGRASEAERIASSKSRARRTARKAGSGLGRAGKKVWSRRRPSAWQQHNAEVADVKKVRSAIARGAAELTRAWTEGSVEPASGRNGESEAWTAVLRRCVESTARKGINASDRDSAESWRYLVTGDWDQNPTTPAIREWAKKIVKQVVMAWKSRPKLASVVAQLNAENGLGLQEALALSSKRIARSLWWIALSTATLAVVGGGGIALLVLFIDKG
jgi:hypothetical protein